MKSYISVPIVSICLAFTLGSSGGAQKKERAAGAAKSKGDDQILRVQLFLDGSDFKPGAIDGRWGEFTGKALSYYEKANGKSGQDYGEKAPKQFDLPFDGARPAEIAYKITTQDTEFVGELPEGPEAKAKLKRLPYATLLELVAEKFHARADFLREINPGYDWKNAKAGDEVKVPNVSKPFELQEAMDLKTKTEKAEKNDTLRTEKDKPEAERYSIFIDVPEKIMELKQGEKIVGSYPITPGSDSLPAPKGDWFVRGFSWMPTFRWDNAMLQSGERSADAHELPPGPNNPVGIIWMELSHDGSGIHGTEEPETIGRTTSHGCIRLSNWNALDLGKKVLPGVHVVIP
ncbi:MAG: L,D-transpeptidase family protein [Chthoniobacterales bacterium]